MGTAVPQKSLSNLCPSISRGLSYERVLLNLLKVYSDAGNLLLVINSSDCEEQYYKSQLDSKYVHEVANTATER